MEINLIEKIIYYNPWWQNKPFESGIKREKYLSGIMPFIKGEEITALIGVRRSGKTTLLFQLIKGLLKNHPANQIVFLQADDTIISSYLKNQGLLYVLEEYINYRKQDSPKGLYVFIDEIQEIENWESQLKNLFDLKKGIKFIISGSSAAKIKSESLKKLVGRITFHEITPLSFDEYILFREKLNLKGGESWPEITDSVKNKLKYRNILKRNFIDYLKFGGYPRIVTEENIMVKENLLRDYIDLIIKRDIASIFSIDQLENLEGIFKFLAKNISGKINYFKIAKETGLKIETVRKYYYYLKQAFLVFDAEFYRTTLKKGRQPHKFYFQDSGIRNILSGSFGLEPGEAELGFLAENFVAQKLKPMGQLKYFEDKMKNETDFIITEKNKLIPLEVKMRNKISAHEFKGLFSFLEQNRLKEGIVITKDYYKEEIIDGKKITFIPVYYL